VNPPVNPNPSSPSINMFQVLEAFKSRWWRSFHVLHSIKIKASL